MSHFPGKALMAVYPFPAISKTLGDALFSWSMGLMSGFEKVSRDETFSSVVIQWSEAVILNGSAQRFFLVSFVCLTRLY